MSYEPTFHLATNGICGGLEIFLPKSSEAFVHFDCSEARSWSYGLGALNQGMRALTVAKETEIRKCERDCSTTWIQELHQNDQEQGRADIAHLVMVDEHRRGLQLFRRGLLGIHVKHFLKVESIRRSWKCLHRSSTE
ncbi:hypothetical protein Naga_100067g10 [Nannochloropsis gaditana]|uniref:Uncharacterized protein n=1 Tax=Nannochloropsis gaditana TaxID=72520 RepID=W7T7F0_9STRA|nr:hypothetical protein Naga_100067g10 [Nannochloropsis gaditana]